MVLPTRQLFLFNFFDNNFKRMNPKIEKKLNANLVLHLKTREESLFVDIKPLFSAIVIPSTTVDLIWKSTEIYIYGGGP